MSLKEQALLIEAIQNRNVDLSIELLSRRGAGDDLAFISKALDTALALEESTFVHILVAFGVSIDIRLAYSATDRLRSPQPFRIMETWSHSPLGHLALVLRPEDSRLLRIIHDRPEWTQAEVIQGLKEAADTFFRDPYELSGFSGIRDGGNAETAGGAETPHDHQLHRSGRYIAPSFRREKDLKALAHSFQGSWSPTQHHIFPLSFRRAVAAVALHWPWASRYIPLEIWRHVFGWLDRSHFSENKKLLKTPEPPVNQPRARAKQKN